MPRAAARGGLDRTSFPRMAATIRYPPTLRGQDVSPGLRRAPLRRLAPVRQCERVRRQRVPPCEAALERLALQLRHRESNLLAIMNRQYTIATLGSHSALQILKGAHDEGFKTLAIANPETERLYRSFAFVDEIISIEQYSDFMGSCRELEKRKIIIVPHGSFVAYLSLDEHKQMSIPYFGNKSVLDWEASRELQRQWLTRAGLNVPRQFSTGAEIDRPGHRQAVRRAGRQGLHVPARRARFRRARRAARASRTTSCKNTSSACRSTSTISTRR